MEKDSRCLRNGTGILSFYEITNRVQLTAVAVTSVCVCLYSKDLLVIPLVIIAVLHLISNLVCLPWFSYSSDFYSLSFEDTPPPRLPGFNWFRKDPSCVFRYVPPVWFAVLHHCCFKSLDLQLVFPLFSCLWESCSLKYC